MQNVYTHSWMTYLLFHNFHFRQCHLVAQVAFWAKVEFWAEVPRFWWRCASSFAPPACLLILCCAILECKAAGSLIFINHCRMSFYCSLHLFMPRKLNSSLLLFSDFGRSFLTSCCVSSTAVYQNRPLAILAIFKARRMSDCSSCTRPPCLARSSRHIENLQQISCCFQKEDVAISTIIYDSIASSKVFKACFVHSWGPLSRNSSAKIPELTTS